MSAIFRTVSQALHVSFIVEQYPINTTAPMPALSSLMKSEFGIIDEPRRTTVNFIGLSPVEIRMQCVDIRKAVRRLSPLQANILEARYSEDTKTRSEAIRAVAAHLQTALGIDAPLYALALAWRYYLPEERRDRDFTVRQIADSFKMSKSTVHRATVKAGNLIPMLEVEAMHALAPAFELAGIVDTMAMAA